MNSQPLIYLNLYGSVLGGFLAISAGVFRRGAGQRTKLLAAFLAIASMAMITIVLRHGGFLLPAIHLRQIENVLTLCAGPVLYLLIRSCTDANLVFTRRSWIHLAPAAVYTVVSLVFRTIALPIEIPLAIQMTYSVLAVRYFRTNGGKGNHRKLAVALLSRMILVHACQVLRLAFPSSPSLREIVPSALSVVFLLLASAAFRNLMVETRHEAGYEKSGLSPERAASIGTRLDEILRDTKPYTDPGLTLAALSRLLDVPSYMLSQFLNQHCRATFREIMNQFRVEEAKLLLSDPENDRYTIEALGQMAGFKSRSAFYSAFQEKVGLTPSRYRKLNRG